MRGLGKATAITQQDIWEIGQSLKVNPAVIDGIGLTESNGAGWFPNGQIKILPEPHIFYKYLPKAKKGPALKAGLATRSYKETKATGHYKRMTSGPGPRYALLEKWIEFDEYAAYMAISTGSFQIMGFNHDACGFVSAKTMFEAFCESEAVQLQAFVNFIKSKDGGLQALRQEAYDKIELLYNGGGQGGTYARMMAANVRKAKNGRWLNYHPSDVSPPQKKSDPVKDLKRGDISPNVEAIQLRLVVWGFDVQPDGKFGALTETAVKDFQKDLGFKVTGRVDEETRLALYKEPSKKEEKKIEEAIKPVIVTETTTKLEPVVPTAARKPFWKSWSMGGVSTIIGGWITSLMTDLDPWMKFTLLLIGIAIAGMIFWNRQKLFNDAKDLLKNVQDFNDNAQPVVDINGNKDT